MLEYIEKAWNVFKKNYLTFIIAQSIAFIIPGIFVILGIFVFMRTFSGSLGLPPLEEQMTEKMMEDYILNIVSNPKTFPLLLRAIGYGSIFFLIAILLSVFLEIGIYGMASESFRKRTRLRIMFQSARKYGSTVILCSIIKFLIILVLLTFSFFLMIIPIIGFFIGMLIIILVIFLFSLTSPAIVDNNGAIEAIKKSAHIVKKNYLSALCLLVMFALIGIIFSFVPWIGFLITLLIIAPLQKITLVGFYRKNKK